MTEAAPAEQAVEAEKKKRLFHRIPTSLLVTFLGIALTAWLLPAFTRQWDDRQKAHELAVALGAEMATNTSKVLEQTRAELYREASTPLAKRRSHASGPAATLPQNEIDWSTASLRIEAMLLASYPRELVQRWRGLREIVAGWIGWYDHTQLSWDPAYQPDPELARAAATIGVPVAGYPKPITALGAMRRFNDDYLKRLTLEDQIATGTEGHDSTANPVTAVAETLNNYRSLEEVLLAIEAGIARDLVDAHVRGYSTSGKDLLHDLIP
ncbi:MAG: hypothetical protein ACJ74P_10060 [Gaiellaceae bacterium]